MDGRRKQYKSGKFATKKEAKDAELGYKMKLFNHENQDKITINEMIDLFVENRTSTIEVKPTTLYNYGNKKTYLKSLLNVKLKISILIIMTNGRKKSMLLIYQQDIRMIYLNF